MDDVLDRKLEKSLYLMKKIGLRPPVLELEELARKDYIDISEVDGWVITLKGFEYLKTVTISDEVDQ